MNGLGKMGGGGMVHYISAYFYKLNNSKVIFSQTNTNTLYMYTWQVFQSITLMHYTIYEVFQDLNPGIKFWLLDVTWLLHINVILYDHGLTDISEQIYSNLSTFFDGVNVQITWETSLHCHGNKRQNKNIKTQLTCQSYYSNIHLSVS